MFSSYKRPTYAVHTCDLWLCCNATCFFVVFLLCPPRRGAKYCDEYVCPSVFLSVHSLSSKTTRLNFASFLRGHVSALPYQHCDTLYTSGSGFVDDVMFSHIVTQLWCVMYTPV